MTYSSRVHLIISIEFVMRGSSLSWNRSAGAGVGNYKTQKNRREIQNFEISVDCRNSFAVEKFHFLSVGAVRNGRREKMPNGHFLSLILGYKDNTCNNFGVGCVGPIPSFDNW